MTRKLMRLQWGANITDSGLWIRVLAASSELPMRHMLLVSVHSDFLRLAEPPVNTSQNSEWKPGHSVLRTIC